MARLAENGRSYRWHIIPLALGRLNLFRPVIRILGVICLAYERESRVSWPCLVGSIRVGRWMSESVHPDSGRLKHHWSAVGAPKHSGRCGARPAKSPVGAPGHRSN